MIYRAVSQLLSCASCGHLGGPNEGIEADERCRRFVTCEVCCARHYVEFLESDRRTFKVLEVCLADADNAKTLPPEAMVSLRTQ
jgi:hypothetical protein